MSSLGFTSKEQRNLGLLVHLMTSNPKILYAPAGSEADRVILKVRASTVCCAWPACVVWNRNWRSWAEGSAGRGPLSRRGQVVWFVELAWEGCSPGSPAPAWLCG